MAKSRVKQAAEPTDEQRLLSAFDVLVDMEAEEMEQLGAIQTVLEMKTKNAELLRTAILRQSPERQEAIGEALKYLNEAESDESEFMADPINEEDVLGEESEDPEDDDIDVREFDPESAGETLPAQIEYAFTFVRSNSENRSAAEAKAMRFLTYHRKKNHEQFCIALGALDKEQRKIAAKVMGLDE